MADRDSKTELLRGISLFALCDDKELRKIASLLDETTVTAGTVLTVEGEPGAQAFVIADGSADVTLRGEVIGTVTAGDAVGEMVLLDRSSPRSATVTARTPMTLFVLEPRSFSQLLEKHPGVTKQIAIALAQRLREVEDAPTY